MKKQACWSVIVAATALSVAPVIGAQYTPTAGTLAQAPGTGKDAATRTAADDREIALRVHAALAKDKEVATLKLMIKVADGVVELSGTARDRGKVNRAIAIARSVPGVKSVKNEVTVS